MRLLTLIRTCLLRKKSVSLPHSAEPIHVDWPIKEGGVQAAAWTDEKGRPYLAIKTLNTIGKTSGLYDWHQVDCFESNFVVGFVDDRPLIVHIFVTVNEIGLELVIRLPRNINGIPDFIERRFSRWGSGSLPMSMTIIPTVDYYASQSFPTFS